MGREPSTDKTRVVSTRRRFPTNWFSRTLQPSKVSIVANFSVPSDFLVDGQVSGLGTVHVLLTLDFFITWIHPLHLWFFPLLLCVQNPFGDGAMDDVGSLRMKLAAYGLSARRRPWSDGR